MATKPKARVIEITNPFDPFYKDAKTWDLSRTIKLRNWLKKRYPGFKKFDRPTIILVNGNPLMQKDWNRVIRPGDLVTIIRLAGTPVVALWIIAIAAVVGVVVALNIKIKSPTIGQGNEADPVYTLKGQRNQIRLGMPIEAAYGRVRMWPSYAAQPYNEYKNNEQWLYQLFCLGQGTFTVDTVYIEDTPAANFSDVEFEICPPGTPVTLFPDNVVTSNEVSNLELFGPNEPHGNAVEIEDSPGDDTADPPIPPTTHLGYSDATAFVANPSGTLANKIQLDVSFPRGLYASGTDGALTNKTVTALFEARAIDNAGAPAGAWFTIADFSKTLATATPQRFTIEADVDPARYEVRAARTNNKDTSDRNADTLQWEALRAFLPSVQDYGDVTMMAMKARASNNLNDQSASRVNVVATRNLETWDGATWSGRTPTRNPVWAYCDIMRSNYGGRLDSQYLELADLKDKADFFNGREDWFDWIFEQRLTVWDALKLACLVGRAIPMPNGSRFGMVRDGPQTIPSHIFNQETIVKNTFRREMKLAQLDDFDGLEVTYTDPITWKEETVLCVMDDETGDNPEKVTLSGCTDRTMAWRWGMWKRAANRYRREQVIFQTGLEGHIPSYGDLVGVVHDIPRWGQGGFVTAIAGDNKTLTLSEPVTFADGVNKVQLRTKNGSASDVYTCTAGVDAFHIVLAVELDPADYAFADNKEPPIFTFGPEDLYNRACVVTGLDPNGDDVVEVTCTPYRSEPHSHDEEEPPALPNTGGNVPGRDSLPNVTGLIVVKSPNIPNEVVATWNATRGANYYVIQLSYDNGTSWETLSSFVETTSFRFTVLPKYLWVRVCAVTTGAGPFAYWMGNAPVEDTTIVIDENITPDPVTDVELIAAFGMIWFKWKDPTTIPAKKIKYIHIYITHGSAAGWDTQPDAPMFSIRPGQQFWSYNGLADNERINAWFEVETVFGRFSTSLGPYSATTINGITLDHLIVGGIQPVEILPAGAPIPSTLNYFGRMVLLQTNDVVGTDTNGNPFLATKVYKWVGGGTPASPVSGKGSWSAAVEAVDITGNLTDSQIASLAAAKLTGQITSTQITDGAISTPKLAAGAVTTNELAANSVVASKIGAGEITAGKIAAGVVTATELAADSVVAGKIAAAAVVASAIGTNEIIAHTANIKDGVITSAKIGDAEITTAKIATANITTLLIDGNAVTVPISASAAGPIVVTASDTEDLVSCNSHEVIGSEPVFMIATFQVTALDNNTHYFRFLQDGSTIIEWEQKIPVIGKNIFCISWAVAPGAGTYNFGLQIYGNAGNSGAGDSFSKISMLTLSTKR